MLDVRDAEAVGDFVFVLLAMAKLHSYEYHVTTWRLTSLFFLKFPRKTSLRCKPLKRELLQRRRFVHFLRNTGTRERVRQMNTRIRGHRCKPGNELPRGIGA